MEIKRILLILVIGYSLPGCYAGHARDNNTAPAINPISNNREIIDTSKSQFITHPEYSNFSVCYGHTCRYSAVLALTEDEVRRIRVIFAQPATSPGHERKQITEAIALLEEMTGEKAGTSNDKAENFTGMGEEGQMDCVDESTNTTVFLTMLQKDQLLKWHRVDSRVSRGIASLQAPHFTAVIRDTQNGDFFAVDSWFLNNGEPPFVVPLPIWKKGWRPGSSL